MCISQRWVQCKSGTGLNAPVSHLFQMSIEQLYPLLLALLSGVWFGFYWWVTQYFDPTKETVKFSLPVLGVTVAYAGAVGVYFSVQGAEITLETLSSYFATNLVLIIFIQRGAQTVWRRFFGCSGDVEI